jgi:hypothetical protein
MPVARRGSTGHLLVCCNMQESSAPPRGIKAVRRITLCGNADPAQAFFGIKVPRANFEYRTERRISTRPSPIGPVPFGVPKGQCHLESPIFNDE